MQVKPQTNPGKWSFWLAIGLFASAAIMMAMVASGQQGGDKFTDNLYLATFGFSIIICGIAAFFAGIFAIIKGKERSLFIYLTTLLGLLVLAFILGKFLSP